MRFLLSLNRPRRAAAPLMITVWCVLCFGAGASAQQQEGAARARSQSSPQQPPSAAATPPRAVSVTNLPGEAPAQVNQRQIDATLAPDAATEEALASYRVRVLELSKPIAHLAADIEKRGIGGGSIGNFVTDAVRAEASRRARRRIPLAILNTGGMRKNSIAAGALTTSDIYELLPFENSLIVVELTGAQIMRLLETLVEARDAQSGATITYTGDTEKRDTRLAAVTLNPKRAGKKPQPISPTNIYAVATLDYLVDRGGNYAVLKEAQRITPLGVILRDAVAEHLRHETAAGRKVSGTLDNRFRRADSTSQTVKEGSR